MFLPLSGAKWNQESQYPASRAGTIVRGSDGNLYRHMQASAALVLGNVTTLLSASGIIINADVDAAAAADTVTVTGTGDFTYGSGNAIVDADFDESSNASKIASLGHPLLLWSDAGATQGQGGWITRRNSNNTVDVYFIHSNDGKIDTAFTASTDYVVVNQTRTQLTTGPTDRTTGVAQYAVTDEYWYWELIFGFGVALLDTSDSDVNTSDFALIPSDSTDGYAEGTTGTETAVEVLAAFGRACGFDQTADGLIPFNAFSLWTHPFVNNGNRVPVDKDAGYPAVA